MILVHLVLFVKIDTMCTSQAVLEALHIKSPCSGLKWPLACETTSKEKAGTPLLKSDDIVSAA